MTDPCDEMPGYYYNKFEGEWQREKDDRKFKRQFAVFCVVLVVALFGLCYLCRLDPTQCCHSSLCRGLP